MERTRQFGLRQWQLHRQCHGRREAQVAQEEADKLAEVEMAKADALAVEQETERLESIDSAKHEAMELETERLRAIEKSKHEALKENQFVNKFWLVVILILGILFML
jgi:regulator of protease activity HflC (stomatin/prohibitin superfamily)